MPLKYNQIEKTRLYRGAPVFMLQQYKYKIWRFTTRPHGFHLIQNGQDLTPFYTKGEYCNYVHVYDCGTIHIHTNRQGHLLFRGSTPQLTSHFGLKVQSINQTQEGAFFATYLPEGFFNMCHNGHAKYALLVNGVDIWPNHTKNRVVSHARYDWASDAIQINPVEYI